MQESCDGGIWIWQANLRACSVAFTTNSLLLDDTDTPPPARESLRYVSDLDSRGIHIGDLQHHERC